MRKAWLKVRSVGGSFDGVGCLKLVRRGDKWRCQDRVPRAPHRFKRFTKSIRKEK